MNKKTIGLLSLAITLAAIVYVAYNNIKNIDIDLFDMDEDIDIEE